MREKDLPFDRTKHACYKENAQNHCNVGNGKIVLDTISDWIQSIDAEAMER